MILVAVCERNGCAWLRTRRLRYGHGTRTILAAAIAVGEDQVFSVEIVAMMMRAQAQTARMGRGCSGRQRNGGKVPQERKNEQQIGGQSMHAFCESDPACKQHTTP